MVDMITAKDKSKCDFIGIQVHDNVQIPKIMCILIYNVRNNKMQHQKSLTSTMNTHVLSDSKDIKGYVCRKSVIAIIRVPKERPIDDPKALVAFLLEWDLLIQRIFIQFRAQKHIKAASKLLQEQPPQNIPTEHPDLSYPFETMDTAEDDAPADWLYAEDNTVQHERAVHSICEGINTYITKLFQEHNQLETQLRELTSFDEQDAGVPTTLNLHFADHSVGALFNEQIDQSFDQLYHAH
jgi:hypothetical protein